MNMPTSKILFWCNQFQKKWHACQTMGLGVNLAE
jgi:hypothetical protein